MFQPFLHAMRRHGVPVSLREYLAFLRAMEAGVVAVDAEAFYHLARCTMVKDERHADRFDRAFSEAFKGLAGVSSDTVLAALDLPRDWLRAQSERLLTPAERDALAASGGFEALIARLRARLAEQRERHAGGATWIGTTGTSAFGAMGDNPEGMRVGQDEGRRSSAVKVWDRRAFRDLADDDALGPRAMKVALRRLRRWAREGAADELDLDGTIQATARQGWLDLRTRPERRNAARVLLFLDVGGSMDGHVRGVEALFAAARSEFRHLEHWYFHNCLYEGVWRENRRRHDAQRPTAELLRTYGPGWTAIFVGDASMSPYEISHPGGAVEHWNPEPGAVWLERACAQWPAHLWINPVPEQIWSQTVSIGMIGRIFGGRMVPLTLDGLAQGMRMLAR